MGGLFLCGTEGIIIEKKYQQYLLNLSQRIKIQKKSQYIHSQDIQNKTKLSKSNKKRLVSIEK